MQNKKNNIALIAIIIVIVAITAGVLGWMFAKKSNNPEQVATPSPTKVETKSTENTKADETADWQKYENKRYGYVISYPKDWYVDSTHSEDGITKRGSEEFPDFMGGDTNWGNYPNPVSYTLENVPKDLQQVFLNINKDDVSKTLDEFISKKLYAPHKKEYLQVDGVQGVRMKFEAQEGSSNPNIEHILIMKNGLFFDFSNGDNAEGNSQTSKDILEKMISTFKFVGDALIDKSLSMKDDSSYEDAEMKSYVNNKFGYEIEIPKNTEVIESGGVSFITYKEKYDYDLMQQNIKKFKDDFDKAHDISWALIAKKLSSENEIKDFIGNAYNKECNFSFEKKETDKSNMLDIEIDPQFEDIDGVPCLNYMYEVKYNPMTKVIVSWTIGQDYNFTLSNGSPGDMKMRESFKFL